MRDRTKKRLRWFLITVAALGVAAVSAYLVRDRQIVRAAAAGRDEGLRLLDNGDYYRALHKIGPYVRRNPTDIDALLAYTRARQNVREPNKKHISEALVLYRRILSLNPRHIGAAESLLKLYQEHGLWTEAMQLSTDLLALDAKNKVALEARAMALFALGRFANDEALLAAMAYSDAHPGDLSGQLLTLEILQRSHDSHDRVLARCAELRNKYPDDPRFILLSGIANVCIGEHEAGRKWLEHACAKEMPDAEALKSLVEYCDRMHMFDASVKALEKHGGKSAEFTSLLTRRLWQLERDDELVKQVDASQSVEAERVALACLSLHRLGRNDEAAARLKTLEQQSTLTADGRIWYPIVKGMIGGETSDYASVIIAGHKALDEKNDANIRFLLAAAYVQAGDAETALQLWQEVATAAPAWPAPLVNLGQATLSAGRFDDAIKLAQAALTRSANNAAAMMLLARSQVTRSIALDAPTGENILSLLDRVAQLSPSEAGVTPLRVHVLAATGRKDAAIETARKALQATPPLSAAGLIQLATVSETQRLGIEEECLAQCEQAHGVTYELAYLRAKRQVDAGQKEQGLELFAKARAQANAHEKSNWDSAWARLLEMADDARAKEAWIAAADNAPNDTLLQWLALSARSVQNDRPFVARTLERLRQRLGDQGFTWRLTRARWLLQEAQGGSQNAVEAALILNDLTRAAPNMLAPRLLLADCLQQLGNMTGAVDQLTAATNLWPQSAAISLQLAKLLHVTGDAARSRVHLDRVVANPASDLAQCREAAEIMDMQGDPVAALRALERGYGEKMSDPPSDLLLAKLFAKTRQLERAQAVCKLLTESNNIADLDFVIDFYTQQGRKEAAQAALTKLRELPAEPGMKEVIFGTHALRGGDHAKAQELLLAATKAAPKNAIAWRQLVRAQLFTGEHDAALKTLQDATAALPDDQALAAALRQAPSAFKLKEKWPELVALISELLESAYEEATFVSAFQELDSAGEAPLTSSAANKIVALAGSRPRMFALQVLGARVCIATGRKEEASQLVRRAAQMRPEAVGLAIQTLATSDRWGELADLLRPKLAEASHWRIEWMKLAAGDVPNPADAAAWLNEVEPLVLKGDVMERLALAECWQALVQRTEDPRYEVRAIEATKRVAAEFAKQSPSADVALSLGCLQEAQGDIDGGEASYRRVLELNPNHPIAQNNLAMLLAKHGGDLEEALALATRAAALGDANVASYCDTLAFVRAQRKEYDAAIETLNAALKLKPDHVWCRIRLTDVLAQSGQTERARQALEELEKELPQRGVLTDEMSSRLRDLRSRLARDHS